MSRRSPDRAWHLDRRIPIALIIALIIQTAGAVWWASALAQRVSALEEKQNTAAMVAPVQSDRLTRVETRVETIQRDVTEIKSDIKSLIINKTGVR